MSLWRRRVVRNLLNSSSKLAGVIRGRSKTKKKYGVGVRKRGLLLNRNDRGYGTHKLQVCDESSHLV